MEGFVVRRRWKTGACNVELLLQFVAILMSGFTSSVNVRRLAGEREAGSRLAFYLVMAMLSYM